MGAVRALRTYRSLAAAGLAVGAIGVLLQLASGADLPRPVPPGVVILTLAAALTIGIRWRWAPVGSALIAVFALLNVVAGQNFDPLFGAEGAGVAAGKWMLLLGALTALFASVLDLPAAPRQDPGEDSTGAPTPAQSPWPRRAQIAGLLVLAPVCAEYLSAYDDSTGDAVRLIGGLIVFSPLYGAPALLIREVSRQAGLGWTGFILLAAGFGLTEAGLADQSLFSVDYRHIESWDETTRGTFIHPLGFSAYNALNFLGGHVIYGICAPIALIEAFRPGRHREPWLGRGGLIIVAMLYLAASGLVLQDSLTNEDSHGSIPQLVGSAVVVLLLVAGAFALGLRPVAVGDSRVPRVRTAFLLGLLVALIYNLSPTTWIGVTFAVAVLVVSAVLVRRTARSREWNLQHIAALAVAFVLTRAVLAFTYFPVIGDVSAARKYGHNVVLLVAMVAISALAVRAAASRGDAPFPADLTGQRSA